MSERGIIRLEEFLATEKVDAEEERVVRKAMKAMEPKERMSVGEGAALINARVGASMSDEVRIGNLSRGIGTGDYGTEYPEEVNAYRTFIGSLPVNVRAFARRSINEAHRNRIATVGQLREAPEETLRGTDFGPGRIQFLKAVFAPREPNG